MGSVGDRRSHYIDYGSDGDFLILGTSGLYLDDSSCVIEDLSSIGGTPVTGVLAAVWRSRQGRV